jgi:hypothetical protein
MSLASTAHSLLLIQRCHFVWDVGFGNTIASQDGAFKECHGCEGQLRGNERPSIRRNLLHELREQFRGGTVLDMKLEGDDQRSHSGSHRRSACSCTEKCKHVC